MGTHENRLIEVVLMSTHNLCFRANIREMMYAPVTPVLLFKNGVCKGSIFNGNVSMIFFQSELYTYFAYLFNCLSKHTYFKI